jgi:hypothetical protein
VTYSDIVMWVWIVALMATLVGLALAGRAVLRAEAALVRVADGLDGVGEIAVARAELDAATRHAAGARVRLHTRLADDD